MANISRRGFLVTAATCTAAAGLPPAAASGTEPVPPPADPAGPGAGPRPRTPARLAACIPVDQPPESASASGDQGTVHATVAVTNLTDVVAINYTISNTGNDTDVYTVYYTDQVTTQTSASIQTLLQPGQSFAGLMHGSLNHDFVFTVEVSDGTVLKLGPVGQLPVCGGTSRPYPTPIFAAAPEVRREQPAEPSAESSAKPSARSSAKPSARSSVKPPVRQDSGAAFRPSRVLGAPTGRTALPPTA